MTALIPSLILDAMSTNTTLSLAWSFSFKGLARLTTNSVLMAHCSNWTPRLGTAGPIAAT